MIPFNIYGHSKFNPPSEETPIVWVDYSDGGSWASSNELGSELVTNGDFSNGLTGWFGDGLSLNLGGAKITNDGLGGNYRLIQEIGSQNNDIELTYEVINNNNCDLLELTPSGGVYFEIPNTIGVHKIIYNKWSDYFYLTFRNSRANSDITIDNISVKEVSENLTTLMNKGTLGGAMTLNGTVKVANGGFESWTESDWITRVLDEPFFTDNSFTLAVNYEYNIAYQTHQYPLVFNSDTSNRVDVLHQSNTNQKIWAVNSGTFTQFNGSAKTGVQTILYTYDLTTNQGILMLQNGTNLATTLPFNNTLNAVITLLTTPLGANGSLGADNPLHEFRLYNRAFTLAEMQALQTELNNKYAGS